MFISNGMDQHHARLERTIKHAASTWLCCNMHDPMDDAMDFMWQVYRHTVYITAWTSLYCVAPPNAPAAVGIRPRFLKNNVLCSWLCSPQCPEDREL